jgi:hypothetical protein
MAHTTDKMESNAREQQPPGVIASLVLGLSRYP